MKRYLRTCIVMILAVVLAAGCAPQANKLVATPGAEGDVAGFWRGLWHGFIMLFTFIVSLFNDSIGVYETHNSGNLYNLGFVLGAMIFFSGSGGGACKKSR